MLTLYHSNSYILVLYLAQMGDVLKGFISMFSATFNFIILFEVCKCHGKCPEVCFAKFIFRCKVNSCLADISLFNTILRNCEKELKSQLILQKTVMLTQVTLIFRTSAIVYFL